MLKRVIFTFTGRDYALSPIFKKNTCGNPSTKGFLGLLNQVLAFVTFLSTQEKYFGALLLFHKRPFKT